MHNQCQADPFGSTFKNFYIRQLLSRKQVGHEKHLDLLFEENIKTAKKIIKNTKYHMQFIPKGVLDMKLETFMTQYEGNFLMACDVIHQEMLNKQLEVENQQILAIENQMKEMAISEQYDIKQHLRVFSQSHKKKVVQETNSKFKNKLVDKTNKAIKNEKKKEQDKLKSNNINEPQIQKQLPLKESSKLPFEVLYMKLDSLIRKDKTFNSDELVNRYLATQGSINIANNDQNAECFNRMQMHNIIKHEGQQK